MADHAPSNAEQPVRARQVVVRRVAMQALFAIDAMQMGSSPSVQEVLEVVEDPHDHGFDALDSRTAEREAAEAQRLAAARLQGVELALEAWAMHKEADRRVLELAPGWPTHRQPPVDRALLRLAYAEMHTRRNAPAVVIHETVELARRFSSERSPAFVNALLDRLKPDVDGGGGVGAEEAGETTRVADPWLADAMKRPEGPSRDGGEDGPL